MQNQKETIEELMAIFTLGLITALQKKAINIDTAESFLFSPRTMNFLRKKSINKKLVDLIHLGTELEDVENLIPEKLESSYEELSKEILEFLEQAPPLIHANNGRTDWYDCLFIQ